MVNINQEIQDGTATFVVRKKGLEAYPIGSIYMSMVNTPPENLFGGEWKQIVDRFIYCADSSKVLGGENEHTLTIDEMPQHSH